MDTTHLTADDVVRHVASLSVEVRKEIVRQIQLTLPYEGLCEDDPDFADRLLRRTEAMESGEDPVIDHETVMRLARARIDRAKHR